MSKEESTKRDINWLSVVLNIQIALCGLCGLKVILFDAFYTTTIFSGILLILSILGATAGAHRLWAHRSYEASTSLKIFLMLCHSLSGQTCIYDWVRLHRLHHKYFKSELDPYNPGKGFVYSHIIANNLKYSAAQEELLKEIDMSDLEQDKIVMFQKKYRWALQAILTVLLPLNAPIEYWNDTLLNSLIVVIWVRLSLTHHLYLLIHSASTVFNLDCDEKVAFESNMVFFINKSYWLSYHYLTPCDYQSGEFGKYGTDCTTKFIRVCAALELATDLKTISSQGVRNALALFVEEKKPLSECLSKQIETNTFDKFLVTSKYS